jgi:ADP-ribose pyrophosphatase YjhB (NUDIX family)
MHTLGAFAIIFDEEAQVLLCHRTDKDLWNLPGGRVELGESPWDTVIREVHEEVGLQVRVERLLGVYAVPERGDLVFNFLCVQTGGALTCSAEADGIGWFKQDSLPANTVRRHVERIVDAYSDSSAVFTRTQT